MQSLTLKFQIEPPQTEIFIGKDLTEALTAFCLPKASFFAIVTDDTVKERIAEPLERKLKDAGLHVKLFSFPPGEKFKTRETKQSLEDRLFKEGFGKDSCLIAVGGGVVCDVGGFLASTYCRGIPLVLVPTTLLAMADASLGGKNGVDLPLGKNLVGTIYQPLAIFMDLLHLKTLSDKELKNGYAEIIKHALIADSSFLTLLENGVSKWKDLDFLEMVTTKSCQIKKKIIEEDPFEKGLRRSVNFGHTVGHAIELLEQYQISHGEAIAIGMLIEASFTLQQYEIKRIESLLKHYAFPLALSPSITGEKLLDAMKLDKKARGGIPRFTLLKQLGEVDPFEGEYCHTVDPSLFLKTVNSFHK